MSPPRCPVCQRGRAGQHFSGLCCRACAAFFKRRVCEGRAKTCRIASHATEIDLGIRCKPCRFGRCLKSGLRAEAERTLTSSNESMITVEEDGGASSPASILSSSTTPTAEEIAVLAPPPKDLPRPIPTMSRSPESIIEVSAISPKPERTNPNALMVPHISQQNFEVGSYDENKKVVQIDTISMPVLSRLVAGYRKLIAMKRSIHAFNEHIIFQECTRMRKTSVKQYNDLLHTYVSLTHDVLSESFHPYAALPNDEKLKIFRKTFAQLHILEDGYRTALYFPDSDDSRLASNYAAYVDGDRLDEFFEAGEDQTKAIKCCAPMIRKIRKLLVRDCLELQLSEIEVAALYGILVWTEACTIMTDPTVAYAARDSIFRDLQTMYSRSLDHASLAIRFGRLLSIVVDVHDLMMEMGDTANFLQIFNFPMGKLGCEAIAAAAID